MDDPVQAQVDAYGAHFEASPDLTAEILGRVEARTWTVDKDRFSRAGESGRCAYQVTDGVISRVVMLA